MNDMEKLYNELRVMEEDARSVTPDEIIIPVKSESTRSAHLDAINAFFIDEKLTNDISYECFLQANALDEKDSKAMHYKYAQKRFSMRQRGTWFEPFSEMNKAIRYGSEKK